MTAFDQQLLVHLRLDALSGGKVADSSGHDRHGIVAGRPSVVADDEFGSSIRFAGADTVSVAEVTPQAKVPNPVHSITGWVRLDAYPARRAWILTLGQAGAGAHHWLINPDGNTQIGVWNGVSSTPPLPLGQWVHLAASYDGRNLTCYVNGKAFGAPIAATFNYTGFPLALAKPNLGELGFAGRLVAFRVYERALTADDVRQVIDDDRSALAAFRRSHPLAFSFHDADAQPVLAIVDDPTGAKMQLEVTNTASQAVAFGAVTGDAAHLELTLRPGVLAQNPKSPLAVTAPDGWTARTGAAPDGSYRVALVAKSGLQLKSGETLRFTLNNVGGDGRGGTRGTRVQLRYDQLTYVDETSLLSGRRIQHLSLVNRRGQEHIPLTVDFVGFNTILSAAGGTGATLKLRITNVSKQPIPLTPSGRDGASAFVFAFDRQPTSGPAVDWALGPAELKAISVSADKWVAANPTEEGQTYVWRLTTPTQVALAAGESVIVTLTGVAGRPPSGHIRLLVHHENIPGYWDGHSAVTIEKGPLVCRDVLVNGTPEPRVGIGTADPAARLQIVHTNQDPNGNALIIGPTNASNLRLGYHADYSWIQSHGQKPLLINPIGNYIGIAVPTAPTATVDIGRSSGPGGTLQIRGTERISHFNYSTDEHTYVRGGKANSNVYINDSGGNVAVGSTDPQGHRLFVNGSAKVLGLSVNSGTRFGRVQAGHFHAGPHGGGVKEVRVDFPERFSAVPQAVVTVRSEGYYNDTFAFTVKYIDPTHFKVNLLRMDAMNAGWQQDLRLDWIAWE